MCDTPKRLQKPCKINKRVRKYSNMLKCISQVYETTLTKHLGTHIYFASISLLVKQRKNVTPCNDNKSHFFIILYYFFLGGSDQINEQQDLLGYISNMTPMIASGSKKYMYFNCHIHTKSQKKRAVFFSPEKKILMARFQEQKSPVKISKFKINFSSPTQDIIINQDTEITQTELNGESAFIPVSVPTASITTLESLANAVPEQLITIKAKVFTLGLVKKIITRNKQELNKRDGILVDPTGQINIVLWQEQVNSIEEGQTYVFKHIKVKDNQYGERYVKPPKNSSTYSATVSRQHEEPLPDVNVLPDTIMQTDAIICGVKYVTIFNACFACNARIIEKNGQASCTKCRMSVKLQLCKSQCFMKVSFMTIPERKIIQLSVFSNEASSLAWLINLNIDYCTIEQLKKQLIHDPNDTLVVSYDSATNKLVGATQK